MGIMSRLVCRSHGHEKRRQLWLWFTVLTLMLLAGAAEAVMTFTTPNVVQASLYQTVRINLQSNIATADPPVVTGDRVYFYNAAGGATCAYTAPGATTQTTFSVTASASGGGYTGTVVVPILASLFTVGTSYSLCYLSTSLQSATTVARPSSVAQSTGLLVWPALYTSYTLQPTAPTGSEGIVNLTIDESAQTGRPLNQALTGSSTIFLVPCAAVLATGTGTTCTSLDTLTQSCAAIGSAGTSATAGVVTLSALRGQGTTSRITGGFTVPYSPDASGYAMCVPYCADTSCSSPSTLSFTVVAASPSPLLSFGAANPGLYTRSPSAPQAREEGFMYFTGSGLTTADAVRVIRADQSCTSSAASLLTNLEVGPVEVASSGSATVQVSFVAPDLVTSSMVGKVCYQRAASGLWSSAYTAAANAPVGDFTIEVLQPSSLTVSPTSPTLGERVQITFAGSGLSTSGDDAFLSISAASNPCAEAALQQGERFNCTMSAAAGTGVPVCTVVVDPPSLNQGLHAAVCYRKADGINYAQLADGVTFADRNPTYTITPYPMYAGQAAVITFTGTGLSASDEVLFVEAGSSCASGTAAAGVEVRAAQEVSSGTAYAYTILGAATTCLDVCYRFVDDTQFVVARAQVALPAVASTCASQQLYIAAFPVRYTVAGATGALTAMETATMRFTSATGASITGNSLAPTAVKLVRATDACVLESCTGLSACERSALDVNYVSSISVASTSATVWLSQASTNMIVCVLSAGSGSAYIPVLPLTTASPTATTYGLIAAAREVTLGTITPTTWRVRLATLGAQFTSTNGRLAAAIDSVYAVNSTGVLSVVSGNAVCALPGSSASSASPLISRLNTTTSTASLVDAVFTRGERLTASEVLYLCYQWSDEGGSARVSYAGTVTVGAAIPTSATPVGMPTSGYSAGLPVTVRFVASSTTGGTAQLQPTVDSVFFYRYVQSSNPSPSCYCDPVTCASGTYVAYDRSLATFTTSAAANSLDFYAPLGFDNYDYRAIYHVCYRSSTAEGVSYMGQLDVAMANPTYYTVSSVAGTVNRVGTPITVTAVRRCLASGCTALSAGDDMVLVPSATQCAAVTSVSEESAVLQIISTTVASGGITYVRRFVVDVVGEYRVCYRLAAETTFHELVYSDQVVRRTLQVVEANPSTYVAVPSAPTAGQFLEIQLTCTDTLCSSCTAIRLIPGTRASCWSTTAVTGTYSSDSCATPTRVQFPDQFVAAGSYTVCYGSNTDTARRVPGVFTMAAANPSTYASASGTVNIYTNQATDFVLDITGTALTAQDSVFLLPALGYTCHDLRTGVIQGNGTLASWLAPSVQAYPLTVTTTGVRWVVSNQSNRFGAGLLDDASLCGTSGSACEMQLCYRRAGTTWGPVAVATPPPVQVVPSNPSSAAFDRYPLFEGMYTMITVNGIGLASTDVVRVHVGDCTGAVVTTPTVTPIVNAAATQWIGVLRFNGTTAADLSYAVCYWQSSSASEIVSFTLPDGSTSESVLIFSSPLYYALSGTNYTSAQYRPSQYEELITGATFYADGTLNIALNAATLIDGDTTVAECNYAPFYTATGSTQTRYPVLNTMEAVASGSATYYQARLVRSQFIALCLQSPTYGLFRVVSPAPSAVRAADDSNALWIQSANPMAFTSHPTSPNPGQFATLTFAVGIPTGTAVTSTAVTPLAVGDTVQIITESRYRCGFNNATVLAEGTVDVADAAGSTASVTLQISPSVDVGALTANGNVTVCYRKQGGTFATTPRGALIDFNLHLAPQIPTQWTSSPGQVQVNGPAVITFVGSSTEPNALQAADRAYLINASGLTTEEATASLCASASPVLSSTESLTLDGVNTQWQIPSNTLQEGVYMFCYVSVANGLPVYVSSPAFFEVYAAVSPYGAYTNKGNTLSVTQGERFYLFFNTSEVLDVLLDDGEQTTAALQGRDVVTLSSTSDCATPLTATSIVSIPASFGYKPENRVDPVSGVAVPYLHLRVRADVGEYYVCMRRANRESWQAYYAAEVVGAGISRPAVLTVSAAPVASFVASPTAPRVSVPDTAVTFSFASTTTVADLAQVFFVPFTGTSTTAADEMLFDDCYRPATVSDAQNDQVTLVDTTLQVDLASLLATHVFPSSGMYLMCYQLNEEGAFISSVFPTALTVNPASPIAYVVPSVIAVQNSFVLGLTYVDGIFASGRSNTMHVYRYTGTDLSLTPSCTDGEAPDAGSTASFTTFTVVNASYATVPPLITTAGYYYVCFLTFDQLQYRPVPNLAGGFVFPVGLTGAQSYTASPQPAYLGQEVHLTINGNSLSSADRAKVVDVTDLVASGSSLSGVCTASAVNADAAESQGAAGSTVESANGIVAHYYPRLNTTGSFALCYQSAAIGADWVYVSTIAYFSVGAAHPTAHEQWPEPTYETEVAYLYIRDTASLLSASDAIKLVARSAAGFDCTEEAVSSTDVGALVYDATMSNSSVAVYRLCGTTVGQLTVCYKLASSPAWAEVPLSSPPATATYIFAPVEWAADPFTGPTVTTVGGLTPRPYEPFNASFISSVAGVSVTYLGFSMAPREVCALDVDYVQPLSYTHITTAENTFSLSLPRAGTYVVHIGTRDNVLDPNITHSTTLAIASCDPCSLSPDYVFVGSSVTVTFPSATGSSLAAGDAMRLIPISQGLEGLPCDSPTGPYADTLFEPVAVGTGGSSTSFTVTGGSQAEAALYLGEYYVCYRKALQSSSGTATQTNPFVLVANDDGVPASFSVYPTDVVVADACPGSNALFGLETVELTVSMRDSQMYPNAAFSSSDQFVLVPEGALTTGSCEELTDDSVAQGAIAGLLRPVVSTITTTTAVWAVTMPRLTEAAAYDACYRLVEDTSFRNVMSTPLTALPANPLSMTYSPPVVLPDSTNVVVTVSGTGLQTGDDVYVVGEGVSCAETCSNAPLTPQSWTGTAHTRVVVNSTTVTLHFNGALNEQTTLGICYRRVGAYLTRIGNLRIGEPNPLSYTTNFVPRVGTRPTLAFYGVQLTSTDAFLIVAPGDDCVVSNAMAVGSFLSIAANATWTRFLLPLDAAGVTAGEYTVCYEVSTVGAYAVVQPELPVLAGGPASFASSNRPMRGRALTLTFPATSTSTYTPQGGDQVFVACPTCSCFDGDSADPTTVSAAYAVVPYGTVSATVPSTNPGGVALRFALGDVARYPVCYKVHDSGFAQVGTRSDSGSGGSATDESLQALMQLVPLANSPSLVTIFPSPTYQGQRLTYNFSGFSTAVPLGGADDVMLVQATRACWENETRLASGIVVSPSAPTALTAESVGRWAAHVPSLGPDTPLPSLFPLAYALCYREAGQPEYVAVPYPINTTTPDTMAAADPSTFTTTPASLETGMLGVTVTFPSAADGDEAYLVQFATLTNTVCTDSDSRVLSVRASSWPSYAMQIPGDATVGASNTALCYIKAGATVAEVPQLVAISAGNPDGYTTNVSVIVPSDARERQYIAFNVTGTGLDASSDDVAFTEVPCGSAGSPIVSGSALARLGDRTTNAQGTELYFVAQFVSATSPLTMYLCYQRGGVWREVGAPLTLEVPQPSSGELFSVSGSLSVPRAGQHLYIALIGGPADAAPAEVAVISADDALSGSWCHNFTAADVREPYLQVANAGLIDIPVWQVAGLARVCVRYPDTIWSDVAASVEAASAYEVMPANPRSLAPYPEPPRVGQRVTLTFFGVTSPSAGDAIKLTAPDNLLPCETADSVVGLEGVFPVTVVDTDRTTATLTDSTDPLAYRSFNRTGTFRVCYYNQVENAWGVVGGTLETGTITVSPQVPQSWSVAAGDLIMGQPFQLQFTDTLGVLNASGDRAWAVPSGHSCAEDPATSTCLGCVSFTFNTTLSNATSVVTTDAVSVIVDDMNICYALCNATPALVEGAMSITAGPIQCIEQDSVVIGQQQTVTFRIEEGVDVSADSWRVSFYATTQSNCEQRYVADFVEGRAVQTTVTSTSVSYALEWPVALTESRYTVCYKHGDVVGPVCTCGQVDGRTGECYIETSPGSPSAFAPWPSPTYVGQTITLTLEVLPAMVLYPPTSVKLVRYVDALSTCADAAAFTTPATVPTAVNTTHFTYSFKHDYALGSSTLLVCALTDLSPSYARVGSAAVALDNVLWIRPYMTLETFPVNPQYVRAMQTLNVTFTHQTKQADDVVSLADEITLVSDPYNCVESFINAQSPDTVMALFELDDTAFLTVPATVSTANAAAFDTTTLMTFNTAGVGAHYVCYRLAQGTWAPVLPVLDILTAAVDSCLLDATASPNNGYDGLAVRAMQYVPLQLLSASVLAGLHSTADQVRIVPQGELCSSDSSAVFTSSTAVDASGTAVDAIWFAPAGGVAYKVCYRFVNASTGIPASNWSPACTNLATIAPSPAGNFTGCFNQGQALDVTATQQGAYVYAAGDTFRYVAGDCLTLSGATSATGSITVGDAAQASTGLALTTAEAGTTVYNVPYAVLGTGTSAVRLCYTDAAGNQFAVPLDYASRPTIAAMPVSGRQPVSVRYQGTLQLGQRLRLNYTAATVTNAVTGTTSLLANPPLTPYALIPSPLAPGPSFDGTFDAATLLSLGTTSAAVYREGRCVAAARASSAASAVNPLGLLGVYGPVLTSAPFTVGAFDPVDAVYHISCYETPTCGVSDVGVPVRVLPYNPSNVHVNVATPRRGQLLDVIFDRDTTSGGSVPLTPGVDRGAKQANLAACWRLADDAGSLVTGTAEETQFTTIFYAQAPALASTTQTRTCYRLSQSAWSEVPGGVSTVLAANPSSFASTPSRRFTTNQLRFSGSGFSAGDTAKIIPLSMNCSAAFAPPSSITAFAADGTALSSSSTGWPLSAVAADGTSAALNFTSTEVGTFSVCYRLATDTVWTLVYSNLVIGEREPQSVVQTPVSTLEGELFTLNFTAGTSSPSTLTASDYVALFYGANANCMRPDDSVAPVITAAPSRNELPTTIAFQLAAGTRGNYTICYFNAQGDGTYLPSWGFSTVQVAPNPQAMHVFPNLSLASGTTTAYHRHQELITLLFEGWGLVATEAKWDAVRLVSATTLPQLDSSCEAVNEVAGGAVHLYPLAANGTFATQVFRSTSTSTSSESRFWVCYKLNGGQFHVVDGEAVTITAAADPSSASELGNKLANSATALNGEQLTWSLTRSATATCSPADMLFYSQHGCNDIPYYEGRAGVTAAAFAELGAAAVSCDGASTSHAVRIGTYITTPTTLSLCYWHNESASTSMVPGAESIPVVAGVPPPLDAVLTTPAQQVFGFTLQVTPSTSDYVVLVKEPASCVGLTPPTDSAYFTNATYNTATGALTVTSAVPTAGTYYICYSHTSSSSAVEHARVVGTVVATGANPQSWRVAPSPLYRNDPATVAFQFTDTTAASAQSTATAWLALVTSNASAVVDVTMSQVATQCANTAPGSATGTAARTAGTAVDLVFASATGTWTSAAALAKAGRFALCYDASGGSSSVARATLSGYPAIFGPAENAGPVVWPSLISAVDFTQVPIQVGEEAVAVVRGGGLSSSDDVLVAVALPSGASTAPADVCTNVSYTPRVVSTVIANSAASTTTMMRSFVFTEAGDYVLCYEPAASGTGAELVSAQPFTVSPSVMSVSAVGQTLFVHTPATFAFTGSGLSASDEAAFVFVGDLSGEEANAVATVCEAAGVTYGVVASASADGTSATFTTTPAVSGTHAMCYRRGGWTSLLATRFTVLEQTVTSAAFTVPPGGCQAYYACLSQPVVTMHNSSGLPASDPSATIALTLLDASTGAAAADGVLSGDALYTRTDNDAAFSFVSMRVTVAGSYRLRAIVTLTGGITTVQTTSDVFTVTANGAVVAVANMTCSPQGILPTATTAVTCDVAALSASSPSAYTVQTSSGTVTACVAAGTTASGWPICRFTVTPPAQTAQAAPTNYLILTVTPGTPYATWPVLNSPTVVWLPSVPETSSALACARSVGSGVSVLPSADLVRVGDRLQCSIQPRVTRNGVAMDAAALPSLVRAQYYLNEQSTAVTGVSLGTSPATMSGAFAFNVTVASARQLTVTGDVDIVDSATSLETWEPVTNSPQHFTVLGVPTAAATTLLCNSTRTGSRRWYTLAEPLQCSLALADASGAVNGLVTDFAVQMPDGGSAQFTGGASDVYGTSFALGGVAPPQAATTTAAVSEAGASTDVHNVASAPRASSLNDVFSVVVSESSSVLTSYDGTLVYVSTVGTVPTLKVGRTATLTFTGSGLDTTHTYVVTDSAQCRADATVRVAATPAAGTTVGELQLTFVVPSATNLYVCFTPADAVASAPAQPLLSRAFVTTTSGGGSSWSTDDLVLLIVGVVFLFILLVLLILLLWRICCFGGMASPSRRRTRHATVNTTSITHHTTSTSRARRDDDVYMPPRANDRFVYRAGITAPSLPATPAPQPQPLHSVESVVPHATAAPPPTDSINVRVTTQSTVQPQAQAQTPPPPRAVAHTDPNQSTTTGSYTTATTRASSRSGDTAHRKKKHHRHRAPSSSGREDAEETVSITSSRHRAHTAAVMAVPPLPPRPTTATGTPPLSGTAPLPGALPDLVETPRATSQAPPPLPPAPVALPGPAAPPPPTTTTPAVLPAVPTGPYQHLHHSGRSSSGTADEARASVPAAAPSVTAPAVTPTPPSPLFSPAEGTEESGAYTVTGHTSRPMVRPRAKRSE